MEKLRETVKPTLRLIMWKKKKKEAWRAVKKQIYRLITKKKSPIFKFSDPFDVKNYRPISIIQILSKLFEFIVYSCIKPILNHIVIEKQHGFRPRKFTISNSVVFTSYLTECLEQKSQMDVIFTDFEKAFGMIVLG